MIENFSRRMFSGSSGTYNVHALELAASTLRKLKGLELTVHFLDHSEHVFHIDKRSKGSVLLDLVYQHLELVEKDYFGLQYTEDKTGTSTECMVSSKYEIFYNYILNIFLFSTIPAFEI